MECFLSRGANKEDLPVRTGSFSGVLLGNTAGLISASVPVVGEGEEEGVVACSTNSMFATSFSGVVGLSTSTTFIITMLSLKECNNGLRG